MRRRTYRAHGRINPYMSSPCHIEVILTEKEDVVAKPSDDIPRAKKEMLQLERIAWVVGARLASSCSVVPSGTHEVVQVQGKLGRSSKQQCRECDLAAAFYKEGKRSGLRKLMKIVTKQREASEATSRCAAFAAALALKLGKVPEAHEMLSRVTMSPAIIRRSLLVNVLVNEGRIDDALDEVEGCLQEDDVIFNSENSCISDEAVRIYSDFVFKLNTTEFDV
ncbi:hypothetical protein ANCCAN_28151 [Ancylostoma caninum]|uniref:Large ribosomal subunit protein uL22 n=1 Tax=Ancylostoma caninum TaxID=29170 RepID=A0A368F548_ANCCA|nr:hypothetical protein ANCCAN_28151 [Ancylostoma caninum]